MMELFLLKLHQCFLLILETFRWRSCTQDTADFLQNFELVRNVIEGGLAPDVRERAVFKGEVRGGGLFEGGPAADGVTAAVEGRLGVCDAHAAEVYADDLTA